MSRFRKIVAGLIVGVGTIAGVSSAQAEILDLEDAVAAPKNPYVSGGFSIQQYDNWPPPPCCSASARDLTPNVNKTLQFNGSTNYLAVNTSNNGAAIVTSTTPGAVFDVSSIDLGSGARFELVDVTVRALDADGVEIASVTFDDQEALSAHPLAGFVEMDSLEITSVQSSNTTVRWRFSFDNINITTSTSTDADDDGVADDVDNCVNDANTGQEDVDGDGIGDVCDPVRNIDIDIKPDSDTNSINLESNGVIPVAILGSTDFDATAVDGGSCRLGEATVKMAGKSDKLLCSEKDVNDDGYLDLVCKFVTIPLVVGDGEDSKAFVICDDPDLTSPEISGMDYINLVPPAE